MTAKEGVTRVGWVCPAAVVGLAGQKGPAGRLASIALGSHWDIKRKQKMPSGLSNAGGQ
jgi:hypothetical protein